MARKRWAGAMKTLVIYESMYGNTREIAEVIADEMADAHAVPVSEVDAHELAAADRVVVGGPTHAFGMSRPSTRVQAEAALAKQPGLTLEPAATGPGMREFLGSADLTGKQVVAFDTRATKVGFPHAARRINALAVRAGGTTVTRPASFLVTRANTLRAGELDRARAWARQLSSVPAKKDVGP